MKTFQIGDILDEADYQAILSIIKKETDYKKVKEVCKKIIKPKMKYINEQLGQKNDPMYISYAVVYAIETTLMNKVARGVIEKQGEDYETEQDK